MCDIGDSEKVLKIRSVEAYKIFTRQDNGALLPQFTGYSYSPVYRPTGSVYQAVDRDTGESSLPSKSNCIGFYAFEKKSQADYYMRSSLRNNHVVKKVRLFGKIVKHETGYRGEFMQILKGK